MKKRTCIPYYGKDEQRKEKIARDPVTPEELSKQLLDDVRQTIRRKAGRV